MQTQRDHVNAYGAQIGRTSAGLLLGEITHADPPARRAGLSLAGGILLAILLGVVFWVYGLIKPGGNTSWSTPGAVVVEEETGNRFVLIDGALHPVTNYASALLLQGEQAHVENLKAKSIEDAPRGPAVGLEGAPDSVPTAAKLLTQAWTMCLPLAGQTPDPSGVGLAFGDVADLPLGDSLALVRSEEGQEFVLWRDLKMRVDDPVVPVVLGLREGPVPTAPALWLDSVTEGPALAPLAVEGAGERGPSIGGRPTTVGQLFTHSTPGGTEQHYVVLDDGLELVSPTEAALLFAVPVTAAPLDDAALAAAPRSADTSATGRIPDLLGLPAAPADEARCLQQTPAPGGYSAALVTVPAAEAVTDGVHVPLGGGVLAAATDAPTGSDEAVPSYLVTDRGYKYLLGSQDATKALGLGQATPFPVPPRVLDLLPSGPTLTRAGVRVSEDGGS